MPPCILINPFEVPPGREEECLQGWEKARAYLAQQPGYISTQLHRALSPGARFTFQAAVGSATFQELIKGMDAFPHSPALYDVVTP
jgi:antibiotic biosynthesis monooxygenase (ABM) superfamily enzyme